MPKLLYQGHGSFRLTANDNTVLFVDPYIGDGYELPADLVLVTHQHEDHNQINLITQKPGCTVITNVEALAGGKHNSFDSHGVLVEAVEAENQNHPIDECVGYIVTIDGVKLYFCGDTSKTKQMSEMAARSLDYVFLCADGYYNMTLQDAAECAELIGAKHNVPVHLKPGELYDRALAEQYKGPNPLLIEPGEEIEL